MTYIRGALLAGGFRSWHDLKSMSADGQRNTMIVELVAHSSQTGAFYQSMDDRTLAGTAALMTMMRIGQIRDDAALRTMSADGTRNTFIAELAGFTGLGDSLQGLDNMALVELALTGHQGVRGALLVGRVVTWHDLNAMSFDDQRNALINTLAAHSSHAVGHYQGLPDSELAACAGVMLLLRDGAVRDVASLRTMSTDAQRNTLIVEIDSYTHLGARLQAFSNADLVRIALGDPFLPRTHDRIDLDAPIDVDVLFPPRQIEVRYVGLQCFGETDIDFDDTPGADEPYFIITTASPRGQQTLRTPMYNDVDSGESRPDDILLYQGPADGLWISLQLMEHDLGDPESFRATVDEAADKAAATVSGVLLGVPGGPVLSGLFIAAWEKWGGDIKDAIVGILGDDKLGFAELTLDPWRLSDLAGAPLQEFRGIHFTFESPLMGNSGSSYKGSFVVRYL